MDSLLFLLQICIPLVSGCVVTVYLQAVTRRLLTQTCGTDERAEFWLRITAVLTIAAPLTLVLIFGRNAPSCASLNGDFLIDAARQATSLSLVGVLVAIAVLARAMWKQIPGVPRMSEPQSVS